jgi:hypothetical protein
MPLVRRHIPHALKLGVPELYGQGEEGNGTAQDTSVLRDVNMAAMTGSLQQLGALAAYASEIFADLVSLADGVASKAAGLRERTDELKRNLPAMEERTRKSVSGTLQVMDKDAECVELLKAVRAAAYKAEASSALEIFLPQSMPVALAERYYSPDVREARQICLPAGT